jgi:hypothetical protein
MLTGKCLDCGGTVRPGNLVVERHVVGTDAMSGIRAHKLVAFLVGAVLLFMIGCTPDSSSSSSGSSNVSDTSTVSQLASNLASDTGGTNDPASDPAGDGPSASIPEPATGLLFLCAAGSMALARLRARKDA